MKKKEANSIKVSTIGLIFIILKICGVINWPWIWVLAPFWIGLAFWMFAFFTIIVIAGILGIIKKGK